MTSEAHEHPLYRRYRQRGVFPREISAGIEIGAPVSLVWQILIDFDHYEEWNPFTPQVVAKLGLGEPVELHVDMPGRSKSVRVEWINRIEDESRICWGMDLGHPALLVANRFQEVTKIDEERTRYYTVDRFSGLVVPLMMALYGEPTRLGFESVARGLKIRAEALYKARR